jgi:hypothetical protein
MIAINLELKTILLKSLEHFHVLLFVGFGFGIWVSLRILLDL